MLGTKPPGHIVAETDRLRLRRWHTADLCNLQGIFGDPAVMEYSDKGVMSQQDQQDWLGRSCIAIYQDGLPGCLAIERKHDLAVIGYVGLSSDPSRVKPGDAEIGFRLARYAWNKGFATEAAIAILSTARENSKLKRFIAIVDPNNRRSVRVITKLGMKLIGGIMLDGYDYPDHIYGRNALPYA
ncbi:GNAT family N-acetyltransferase [Cognatiyoonia sp. IB215182]|uniref:GNAT family N-acetyltransferase n=1 Tax=Cognatiyoonia sp. IB215182 TaxID=3097353 RepID=UPI002A17BC55|nr:GNAT family N-acetyltransferase [Cognatiyoonia sp. IB215182]MDX8355727.1 GNAT family N-acetyltransferase [Cognatiyoonia sp. IB215182]